MNWRIRDFTPDDRRFVLEFWLHSHASSGYGRRRGLVVPVTNARGFREWTRQPQAFRAYWGEHEPLVHRLIDRSQVLVLCDPEAPEVIWAFAAREPGAVHMAVRKRKFREYGRDMLSSLLPVEDRIVCTHEMPDVEEDFGRNPYRYDEFWIGRNL